MYLLKGRSNFPSEQIKGLSASKHFHILVQLLVLNSTTFVQLQKG